MAIEKQMELFEDGGLQDEGGTTDPVSGNDVPVGSTQEEVRDDIPAQLSEGEFVLPADVVRYHGLEKIMALRDEAKMGLSRMDAMGQMGNSEEAIIPDDIPFSIEDLEIDDSDDPMEMQVGGFVQPQPYGIYQAPTTTGTAPSQFSQYGQVVQPTTPFQPFGAGQVQSGQTNYVPTTYGQPTGVPQGTQYTFGQMMPTVGGTSETREYRNAAGQSLYIPFVNGQPVYPIPEGYTEYKAEDIAQTTPKEEDARISTTKITEGGGGDKDPDTPRTGYITIADPSNTVNGQKTLSVQVGSGARGQSTVGTENFLGLGLDTTQPGPVFDLVDSSTGARIGLTPEEATLLNASGIQSGSLKAETDFKSSGLPEGLNDAMDRLSFQNDIKSVENTEAFNNLTDKLGLPSTREVTISDVLKPGGLITQVIKDISGAFDKNAKAEEAASRALAVDIANGAKQTGVSFEEFSNEVSKYLDDPTVTGTKTAAQAAATPVFAPNPKTGVLEQVSGKPTSALSQATKAEASVSTSAGLNKDQRVAMTANSLMDLGMNPTEAYNAAVSAETRGVVDPYTAAALGGRPTATKTSFSTPDRDTGSDSAGTPAASDTGPQIGAAIGGKDFGPSGPSKDSSNDGGSSKIVCTAMNNAYGFGSFRQTVWLQHSKNMDPAYQKGYHRIFKPLIRIAYKDNNWYNMFVRKTLEGIARRRTADIWMQKHGKRHLRGAVERAILEPLCYIVGKIK